MIARDGELCDFKDGEANSFRIWLEMKESGENLLGYMVKSGIEGLEKKNGIGENGISQATLWQNFINAYGKTAMEFPFLRGFFVRTSESFKYVLQTYFPLV